MRTHVCMCIRTHICICIQTPMVDGASAADIEVRVKNIAGFLEGSTVLLSPNQGAEEEAVIVPPPAGLDKEMKRREMRGPPAGNGVAMVRAARAEQPARVDLAARMSATPSPPPTDEDDPLKAILDRADDR